MEYETMNDYSPALERAFAEGQATERERCAGLAKFLRPETHDLVAEAVEKGWFPDQILDRFLAVLQFKVPPTEKEVLSEAVQRAMAKAGHRPRTAQARSPHAARLAQVGGFLAAQEYTESGS
jgi:hypothetical protein